MYILHPVWCRAEPLLCRVPARVLPTNPSQQIIQVLFKGHLFSMFWHKSGERRFAKSGNFRLSGCILNSPLKSIKRAHLDFTINRNVALVILQYRFYFKFIAQTNFMLDLVLVIFFLGGGGVGRIKRVEGTPNLLQIYIQIEVMHVDFGLAGTQTLF